MASGLYIDNDLLTLASLGIDGECRFFGFSGEQATYLYFLPDEENDPPVRLESIARSQYYPGNEDVFGNLLKFADHKSERYVTQGKRFKRYDVLDKVIGRLLYENAEHFSINSNQKTDDPFFLIIPPTISEKLKNRLLRTIRKSIKKVYCLDYIKPAVYNLYLRGHLKEGNVMFLDLSPADIYISIVNISLKSNRLKISILREERIVDTDLFYNTNRLISTEIVNSAYLENIDDPDQEADTNRKNREILYHMPDAQDIITELNEIEEWNSVEMEFESSDGKDCSVIIHKKKLYEKFRELDGAVDLTEKMDYLVAKYQPQTIILHGVYFSNPFLSELLKTFKECNKVYLEPDYYQETCNTVLGHAGIIGSLNLGKPIPVVVEEKDTGVKKRADVKMKTVETEPESSKELEIKSDAVVILETEEKDDTGRKRPGRAKKVILAILIPCLLLAAGYLGYQYLFLDKDPLNMFGRNTIVIKDIPIHDALVADSTGADSTQNVGSKTIPDSLLAENVEVPDEEDIQVENEIKIKEETSNIEKSKTKPQTKKIKEPEPEVISVNYEILNLIAYIGETRDIIIRANAPWTIEQKPDWVSLVPDTGTLGDSLVLVTVISEDFDSLNGELIITSPLVKGFYKKVILKLDTNWKWGSYELTTYLSSLNPSVSIDYNDLYLHINPECRVYHYLDSERTESSTSLIKFLQEAQLGRNRKLNLDSIRYDEMGKINEFGYEI